MSVTIGMASPWFPGGGAEFLSASPLTAYATQKQAATSARIPITAIARAGAARRSDSKATARGLCGSALDAARQRAGGFPSVTLVSSRRIRLSS
ncbi:MAG TPA: hypothetical protein VGO79_15360, partial [Thermoanaerobaculia bacterium]